MMILGNFRLCALGALLAMLAAPAYAAAPKQAVDAQRPASAGNQSADASRSRRVELPFPLDFRAPESAPRSSPQPEDTGPHPFRESQLKRASLDGSTPFAMRGHRLSRQPDFS